MIQELSDLELIENVQSEKDVQDSLTQLIERHSGIYLDMVNVYASPNSPFIDYEDLIKDPKETLIKMLNFIFRLSNNQSNIDLKKVDQVISSTTFEKLKTLENKFGFEEKSSKADKNFFNLGKKNKWQETLDPGLLKMLTDEFKEEMTELSYL